MRTLGIFLSALALLSAAAPASPAQTGTGSVSVGGSVGGAVFLTVAQTAESPAAFTYLRLDAHTVRVFIPSVAGESRRVSVPLQLRSNVGYRLSAAAGAGAVRELCVEGARASGRFVSAGAVEAVSVRCAAASADQILLRGPSISLSGTPASPSNALEVTLVVEVDSAAGPAAAELTLSAAPAP